MLGEREARVGVIPGDLIGLFEEDLGNGFFIPFAWEFSGTCGDLTLLIKAGEGEERHE